MFRFYSPGKQFYIFKISTVVAKNRQIIYAESRLEFLKHCITRNLVTRLSKYISKARDIAKLSDKRLYNPIFMSIL